MYYNVHLVYGIIKAIASVASITMSTWGPTFRKWEMQVVPALLAISAIVGAATTTTLLPQATGVAYNYMAVFIVHAVVFAGIFLDACSNGRQAMRLYRQGWMFVSLIAGATKFTNAFYLARLPSTSDQLPNQVEAQPVMEYVDAFLDFAIFICMAVSLWLSKKGAFKGELNIAAFWYYVGQILILASGLWMVLMPVMLFTPRGAAYTARDVAADMSYMLGGAAFCITGLYLLILPFLLGLFLSFIPMCKTRVEKLSSFTLETFLDKALEFENHSEKAGFKRVPSKGKIAVGNDE
jgi:hypothetical protein